MDLAPSGIGNSRGLVVPSGHGKTPTNSSARLTALLGQSGVLELHMDGKRCRLNWSMQRWLGVYPLEFEIPTFFVAVD